MKNILVLGAGFSSSYLISFLLEQAAQNDWFVTVGERQVKLARKRINAHPRGTAIAFDINDAEMRATQIEKADLVINMLPPNFQYLTALDCIYHSKHMISASYRTKRVRDLDLDANRKGVLILSEMGLDPGIDHMIAMSLVQKVRAEGGSIHSFKSYGGALPAPDSLTNPLRYFITWNPRNVVMSGEHGAQYLENGKVKIVPFHHLFLHSWHVQIDGIGEMEVYPNRDSLSYRNNFDIDHAKTVIRGTIRYPGWCETWLQIARLGIPNENLRIPHLPSLTYRDLVEIFIPVEVSGADLEQRVASFLHINPTGKIMENLKWLGLFSDEVIGGARETGAEIMNDLLQRKLKMPSDCRDMVVLATELEVGYSENSEPSERINATLIEYGERNGLSALSKTVGLPIGLTAKLLLENQIPITGCHIPTHPAVYVPVLKELRGAGLQFSEKTSPIP
jgi:saccharopine dehydrogenase (NADP+, L-glutamate forming)